MKIRAFIVDDEPLARQRVRLLLGDESDVDIVGEAGDGETAVTQIKHTRPDLLFLDVQMPGMDGFTVLENLPAEAMPIVIFTTAYDKHALRAFDAHALDYLLKPFKPQRFSEAVQLARDQLANRQAGTAACGLLEFLVGRRAPTARLKRLAVKNTDSVVFVEVEDIDVIEAAGKYAVVHVGKERHVLRETMTALESSLSPEHFLRISRSVIVNLNQVHQLQPMFKGENVVILKNGQRYPTTRPLREIQQKLEFHPEKPTIGSEGAA